MIIVGPRAYIISPSGTKYRLIAIFRRGIIMYVSRYKKDDRAPSSTRLPLVPAIIDLPSGEIVSPLLGPTPGIIDTTRRVRRIREGSRGTAAITRGVVNDVASEFQVSDPCEFVGRR